MKFWIDENTPHPLGKAVKQAGYDTCIAQCGTDDLAILEQAIKANAVIITQDQDFERYVLREISGRMWTLPSGKQSVARDLSGNRVLLFSRDIQ
jgi:rRNA-processing protein FCF1